MCSTATTPEFDARAPAPPRPSTIAEAIAGHAETRPEAPALLAPNRVPVTYAVLQELLKGGLDSLADNGARGCSRVALALAPGIEAVVATLATMCCTRALPMGSSLTKSEYDARFETLRPDLLVVPWSGGSEAAACAKARGVPVLRWPNAASLLSNPRERSLPSQRDGRAACDVAVVLPTSGTTGEPKRVPLTHANLLASAGHIIDALALTPGDRFLNVATLHHVAGLGLVLASLVAGASTVCAPGYHGVEILSWIDEFQPTWMWLAPAMLRDLVRRDRGALRQVVERGRLRFVRTGSAPLQASLLEEAESVLGVPILETYGMTEAAPQISCAPLPPRLRKPGSAGVPAGPEIRILRDDGTQAPVGQTGEIVIRGANVMSGYEDAAAVVSSTAFADGWFRTGDLGYFDQDGYLFVAGRRRDLINCGGEKISPREVEEALLAHPAVADAVAFPIPHERLGEVVGGVVARLAHAEVSETELRHFVAERLARHKVPSRLAILAEIPRTPAGKIDRTAIAATYGALVCSPRDAASAAAASPEDGCELQSRLAAIWARVLQREDVGRHEDFFRIGGDSLGMAQLLLAVEEEFGVSGAVLELEFCEAPTVATQARVIAQAHGRDHAPTSRRGIVAVPSTSGRLRAGASAAVHAVEGPLFFVPLAGGNPYYLMSFAARVAASRPVYFLDPEELARDDEPTVERLAARCIEAIVELDPTGPYLLSGHCFGGIVSYEIARQLTAAGRRVGLLAFFDTPMPGYPDPVRDFGVCLRAAGHYTWKSVSTGAPLAVAASVSRSIVRHARRLVQGRVEQAVRLLGAPTSARMLWRYQPGRYTGRVHQLIVSENPQTGTPLDRRLGWRRLVTSFDVSLIDASHYTMFDADHVGQAAAFLERALEAAGSGASGPACRVDARRSEVARAALA